MATIADVGYPTLREVVATLAPDGSVEQMMANTLTKLLPMLDDIPVVRGNLPSGDQIVSVTGLPSPTWRRLNAGVPPTKGLTAQYVETAGLLEDYSNVDIAVANKVGRGNPAAYRASQDRLKDQAFSEEIERAFIYESSLSNPEKIHGLTPRYPATSGYTSSSYVLKPGTNSGSNCRSIWLINWDPETIAAFYPDDGSVAGLQREDRGQQTIRDASGNQFEAWVTHLVWNVGLRVKDYRHAVRLQWDPDDATNFADTAKGMYLGMQQMLNTIYTTGPGTRFYLDRTSMTKLDAQLASNDANFLTYLDSARGQVRAFMGIPMRKCDTLAAESAIS